MLKKWHYLQLPVTAEYVTCIHKGYSGTRVGVNFKHVCVQIKTCICLI